MTRGGPAEGREVYYFGCWDGLGHYLHDRHGRTVRQVGPWADWQLEGKYAPRTVPAEDETQCRVFVRDRWTVLAMWDRSVDKRGKCNAAFLAPGEHDEAAMWDLAREAFPKIVARLKAAPSAVQQENEP